MLSALQGSSCRLRAVWEAVDLKKGAGRKQCLLPFLHTAGTRSATASAKARLPPQLRRQEMLLIGTLSQAEDTGEEVLESQLRCSNKEALAGRPPPHAVSTITESPSFTGHLRWKLASNNCCCCCCCCHNGVLYYQYAEDMASSPEGTRR